MGGALVVRAMQPAVRRRHLTADEFERMAEIGILHSGLPRPADMLLIVEVADTTLRHDRTVKLPLYAAAGIA